MGVFLVLRDATTPGRGDVLVMDLLVPRAGFRYRKNEQRFPGGPVVNTSPSNAGSKGLIPGQGAKIPTCLSAKKPKHKPETIL